MPSLSETQQKSDTFMLGRRHMDLHNTGLILEGGGLRGVYTSGVLRYFMDRGLYFPYVIGVSMGACNAASYISHQPERNRIVNIRYVRDPRHISYRRLLRQGELFGMDFVFDTVPNKLEPFDMDAFMNSDQECVTTATDCMTGEPVYFYKKDLGDDYMTILQASCSLPFVAQPVHYQGRILMDGGLSDSIPLKKSMADGNSKNVVILTQPAHFRKTPSDAMRMVRLRYPAYPGMCRAFIDRPLHYNATLDLIDDMERNGEVFAIRPSVDLQVGRAERDQQKLYLTYDKGYADAERCYDKLSDYLNG